MTPKTLRGRRRRTPLVVEILLEEKGVLAGGVGEAQHDAVDWYRPVGGVEGEVRRLQPLGDVARVGERGGERDDADGGRCGGGSHGVRGEGRDDYAAARRRSRCWRRAAR